MKQEHKNKIWWVGKTLIYIFVFGLLWHILPSYANLFMIIWYGGLFFQSAFFHRYAAHGSYYMSPKTEKVFFIGAAIMQGSSYLSAFAYGILHRIHHEFTDTEKDPHSPSYDSSAFRMMRRTVRIYRNIFLHHMHDGELVDHKYIKNLPAWHTFDRFVHSWLPRIIWVILYAFIYILLGIKGNTSWWEWIIIACLFIISCGMSPIHGVIINWWGHIYGYHNYKLDNTSTNISLGKPHIAKLLKVPASIIMNFLMMGEDLHNNHHNRSANINFAEKWWEYDIIYALLLLLDGIGIIKIPPEKYSFC